ncbi:Inner membrane protein YgaZ [Roseovarius albus]|uniref:Inner membrane protein YgaZ n=1 Tax=Roseovarius albus TaxID=1247867 RepID=A0A1X6ZW26_9RHOB|nr:AzlC family ABC transporter permease [Roseovarius albus]SLN63317.1 Inner membrane protein YgaZ [Roseovarius albus]
MPTETTKSIFFRGVRDAAPFLLVVGPFALLFGVVATEAGLSVFETLSFSVAVIAGAAQFTALALMEDQVPTIIVLISALAVNLRMAMYSASLTPYLGGATLGQRAVAAYFLVDQSYALSILKFETNPDMTMPQRLAYFSGTVAAVCPFWYVFTFAGSLIGESIPESLALDFAVPITFLALITPMLRSRAHVAAAFVSIVMALLFVWLPFNLGLLVAGITAMMTGAEIERRTTLRSGGNA